MNYHPPLVKILIMIVGAHPVFFVASSFQLCGFDVAKSLFVQETQASKDFDLTCSTTFLYVDLPECQERRRGKHKSTLRGAGLTFPNVKNDAGKHKSTKSQCFFEGVAGLMCWS